MRRTVVIVAIAAVAVLVSLGLSRLEPAAPTVQKETLYIDTVKRVGVDPFKERVYATH